MSDVASAILPTDPAERRRLWRAWIETDPPSGDRMRITPAVRRVESNDWLDVTIDQPLGVIAELQAAVEASLLDGQIRLSDRQRLTRRAMRLGLSRFEASLLIAAVQHRAGARAPRRISTICPRSSIGWLVAAVIAIEAIVITGAMINF